MRVLHLTHHAGCEAEIDFVAGRLGFDVVHERYDDGYNIGPERAARSWAAHGERWSSYDWAITSDTAPLSRLFLQNGFAGRLIVWVCNRFDYADQATNDCGFPDPEYYELIRRAATLPTVALVSYNEFEHHYARARHVEIGRLTIRPTGNGTSSAAGPRVPDWVDRGRSFFIPPYHNDTLFMDVAAECRAHAIPVYCGRYAGADDLHGFRGVIHVPYAFSTFAFFENLQRGLVHFVPTRCFLRRLAGRRRLWRRLANRPGFFWTSNFDQANLDLAEWYRPDHADVCVYFDSWSDLATRARDPGLDARRGAVAAFAARHTEVTLEQWRGVFRGLGASVA